MAIIAGFDPPSVKNLGYSLFSINQSKKTIRLKEAGVIQLESEYEEEEYDYDFAVKTSKLEKYLRDFYDDNNIKEIVIEKQVLPARGSRYYPPLICVQTGLMANVVEKLAYENGVARHRIHNKTLKKQITGNGACSKQDMMEKMMKDLALNLDYEAEDCTEKQYLDKFEHCFDSMALAIGQYSNYQILPYGNFKPKIYKID